MQDTQSINKARAIYYNLFANFFVPNSSTKGFKICSKIQISIKNSWLFYTHLLSLKDYI